MENGEVWSTVLALLKKEGALTLAQIGQRLWGVPEVRDGAFARPAGVVVKAMLKADLVEEAGRCPVSDARKYRVKDRGPDLFS